MERVDAKTCSKCGKEKPLSEFGIYRRTKDGLNYQCKSCQKLSSAAWTASQTSAQFTAEDIAEAFAASAANGGVCPICRLRPATCIDHDHETGTLRGVTCRQCNAGMGLLMDDPEVMERALIWLEADLVVAELAIAGS